MAKLHELRKLIRTAIMQEMNSTASSGTIGTGTDIIQTPNAFTGGTSKGEARRKKIGTVLGMKLAPPKRKGAISETRRKLFEDVINKVDFDIKMSDQAKELMDFVMGSERYKEDMKDIKELFDRMQADGTFTKEDAFKVYQDFIQRAARDFTKETGVNMKADEYFLRKDILDVVYYNLAKIEDPMSGQPNDNIDGGAEAGAAPPAPSGDMGDVGGGSGGSTGGGGGGGMTMPPTGEEMPPEGGEVGPDGQPLPPAEPGAEGAPTGAEGEELPPEGEEEAPPKPEEIAELSHMIREIYEDIKPEESKLEELEALRATTKELATKYARGGDRGLAQELVKMMNYLDKLSDKFAIQPAAPKQVIKKRMK